MDNRNLLTRIRIFFRLSFVIAGLCFLGISRARAGLPAQQPTVSIPTVTGTPAGPSITVNMDQQKVYVHTGPGLNYPVIGILVTGQTVPAKAVSREGDWIEIVYYGVPGDSGWIYSRLVTLDEGTLPEVTPPPTPTPKYTPTINPTAEARFGAKIEPTRLPTYTAAAPFAVPTFSASEQTAGISAPPIGFVIAGLVVVGVFGVVLSFLRGR